MIKHDVVLENISSDLGGELSNNFYRNCVFCDKFIKINELNFNSCKNIGRSEYCPFCLRNNFHFKNNHNILVFSFRAIFGYYYHKLYRVKPPRIWLSKIEEIIVDHEETGLSNPVLSYDPETFLWFADFNRIGHGRKADFEEVIEVIGRIFDKLAIDEKFPHVLDAMWDKFDKAIRLFYSQRKRPKDKRMLIPTFVNCVAHEPDEFWELTRNFTKSNMVCK